MDPDLTLVIGIVLGVLSVPSMVSAISQGRPPRAAAIVAIFAGGLMVWAINHNPGGYALGELPDVVYRVLDRMVG